MSKLVKSAESIRKVELAKKRIEARKKSEIVVATGKTNAVVNQMGGISYTLNPLETLKLIVASSIFGEPQYYRQGEDGEKKITDALFTVSASFRQYMIPEMSAYLGKRTSNIMEEAIDKALDFNFGATLAFTVQLRRFYNMRLNPQVIMVRAAIHPKREEFTAKNPGVFDRINQEVMSRADEPASQFAYYLFKNKTKKGLPNILKKSWKNRIERMNAYQMFKYKNTGLGLIDVVRVSHASGKLVDELMKTGTVTVKEDEKTWETLRSQKIGWKEIFRQIDMQHMALLRNLRGVFTEVNDATFAEAYLLKLKAGVKDGKQFPFRYQTAYGEIEKVSLNHKAMILDALEECIDLALENLPALNGNTVCMSDNSGSAWGALTSEYGTTKVAEIGNLSSAMIARRSQSGSVVVFGNSHIEIPIGKRNGLLSESKKVNAEGQKVGRDTENGIWTYLDHAIRNRVKIDNLFVFSDMQAGHGGLYGLDSSKYSEYSLSTDTRFIDVNKMIKAYRENVNPKINVYMVQTAGYGNVLVPEQGYRTTILTGWTGKELMFADVVNKFWDEYDSSKIVQPKQ